MTSDRDDSEHHDGGKVPQRRTTFAEGDIAMLYDRRRRRYRLPLKAGASFSTHTGSIFHDDIIGRPEGFTAITSKGHRLVVVRPTFHEGVVELPRQSQVIYPKDLGAIIMRGDIFPGANVVEVGLGSGASAAAILRAIGPSGSLVSYEVREEIIEPSRANVAELAPESTNHEIVAADVYVDGVRETNVDRMLCDIPEPWRITDMAANTLRLGGVFTSFLPTILQVHQLTMALTMDTRWRLVESFELIERAWHVSDRSVRPEHHMVAHTGFLTTARRCEPVDEPEAESDEPEVSEAEVPEPENS